MSDFYPGILVAWQLDGIKFTLGPTIATTRTRLAGFGGYAAIENRPADDLLVGRLIAGQGYEVVLLPYAIETVADYGSFRELLYKRLRWMVVMRNLRPWRSLRPDLHAGISLVPRRGCGASGRTCGRSVFGGISDPPGRDDHHHRQLGTESTQPLGKPVAHSAVGRTGVCPVAGQLFTQQHPLARGRLLHPRRPGWFPSNRLRELKERRPDEPRPGDHFNGSSSTAAIQ